MRASDLACKALRQLSRHLPPGANPDEHVPVIAATLRSTAADIELMKVEQLGGLATAIFERIASTDGDVRGLFSAEAAADYTKPSAEKCALNKSSRS